MWQQWRVEGVLPIAGGWLEQPLEVTSAFEAMEVAYAAGQESDWSKLTPLQRELKLYLEADE